MAGRLGGRVAGWLGGQVARWPSELHQTILDYMRAWRLRASSLFDVHNYLRYIFINTMCSCVCYYIPTWIIIRARHWTGERTKHDDGRGHGGTGVQRSRTTTGRADRGDKRTARGQWRRDGRIYIIFISVYVYICAYIERYLCLLCNHVGIHNFNSLRN